MIPMKSTSLFTVFIVAVVVSTVSVVLSLVATFFPFVLFAGLVLGLLALVIAPWVSRENDRIEREQLNQTHTPWKGGINEVHLASN